MEKKKRNKLRIIAEILFGVAAILLLLHLLQEHAPNIVKMLTSGNASEIDEYLSKYGTEGKLLLVLLQVIETVSIVLPATPVYICAGIMFGKIRGILVCYGTNLVLNLIIFLAARKLEKRKKGGPASEPLQNSKKLGSKLGTVEHMMEHATRMDRVVLAMCLMPIVPNGTIPYLSAKTVVTTPQFMRALAIGSLPSIAVYVCCGDLLVSDSWKVMLPILPVLVVITALIFIFRKKLVAVLEPKLHRFLGM